MTELNKEELKLEDMSMLSGCNKCPTGNRGYNEDVCYSCHVWMERELLNNAGLYICPDCKKGLDAFVEYCPGPTLIYRCHKCDKLFAENELVEHSPE